MLVNVLVGSLLNTGHIKVVVQYPTHQLVCTHRQDNIIPDVRSLDLADRPEDESTGLCTLDRFNVRQQRKAGRHAFTGTLIQLSQDFGILISSSFNTPPTLGYDLLDFIGRDELYSTSLIEQKVSQGYIIRQSIALLSEQRGQHFKIL
ncbi:MAG: hypothetical protein D6746_05010 [Bacteroidetes bacterium]|nr:MAG: hypothetical protein D6746_05010 [Bacteroidota bacterium]